MHADTKRSHLGNRHALPSTRHLPTQLLHTGKQDLSPNPPPTRASSALSHPTQSWSSRPFRAPQGVGTSPKLRLVGVEACEWSQPVRKSSMRTEQCWCAAVSSDPKRRTPLFISLALHSRDTCAAIHEPRCRRCKQRQHPYLLKVGRQDRQWHRDDKRSEQHKAQHQCLCNPRQRVNVPVSDLMQALRKGQRG